MRIIIYVLLAIASLKYFEVTDDTYDTNYFIVNAQNIPIQIEICEQRKNVAIDNGNTEKAMEIEKFQDCVAAREAFALLKKSNHLGVIEKPINNIRAAKFDDTLSGI